MTGTLAASAPGDTGKHFNCRLFRCRNVSGGSKGGWALLGESYKPLPSDLTPGPCRDDTGHQRKEGVGDLSTQAEDVCVTHAASDLAHLARIRHVHVPALFDDLLALRLRALGKARAGPSSKVTNPSGIRIPTESFLLIDQLPGCQMSRHCQRVGASPWPGLMCQARFRRQLSRVSMMVQLVHELCHGEVSPQKILTDCSSCNVWELVRGFYDSSRRGHW